MTTITVYDETQKETKVITHDCVQQCKVCPLESNGCAVHPKNRLYY